MNEPFKPHSSQPDLSIPSGADVSVLNYEQRRRALRDEQNLGLGVVGGLVAVVISAILWAVISVIFGSQSAYMAIGVGFLVGTGVRLAGRGIDPPFGIVGAVLALFGCVLGNLLASAIFIARAFELTFMQVVGTMNLAIIIDVLRATFSPIDLLFYGLALYVGYRASIRTVA